MVAETIEAGDKYWNISRAFDDPYDPDSTERLWAEEESRVASIPVSITKATFLKYYLKRKRRLKRK